VDDKIALDVLHGTVVSIVHTENEHEIRIISIRKATGREINSYREEIDRHKRESHHARGQHHLHREGR